MTRKELYRKLRKVGRAILRNAFWYAKLVTRDGAIPEDASVIIKIPAGGEVTYTISMEEAKE